MIFYRCKVLWQTYFRTKSDALFKVGRHEIKLFFIKSLKEAQCCTLCRVALRQFGFCDCTIASDARWSQGDPDPDTEFYLNVDPDPDQGFANTFISILLSI